MLTLTPAAGDRLEELIANSGAPEGVCVRIVKGDDNALKMALDREQPQDTTIQHHEKTILVLDPQTAEVLEQNTLDIRETPEGAAQLVLT